ncbi:hypothetical protein [Actinopolymorpha pittospori]|uniref:Uncharacterized protein n=1 Tax=Actinopolymorpha pittospori TaxID=648752 RepID=A0A927RG34_9ACTN|nr:hypothetical protein [Actinopolymorpha pittospori]MBE1603856.1 hypothetical protein [Actinopolymorpha pittospori]
MNTVLSQLWALRRFMASEVKAESFPGIDRAIGSGEGAPEGVLHLLRGPPVPVDEPDQVVFCIRGVRERWRNGNSLAAPSWRTGAAVEELLPRLLPPLAEADQVTRLIEVAAREPVGRAVDVTVLENPDLPTGKYSSPIRWGR